MGKHFPTIIASIMLIAMLGLMSNCQVDADVPLEYQSPMETSEHLDENGEEMKKESSIGNSKEINKILEKNFIFLRSNAMSLLRI